VDGRGKALRALSPWTHRRRRHRPRPRDLPRDRIPPRRRHRAAHRPRRGHDGHGDATNSERRAGVTSRLLKNACSTGACARSGASDPGRQRARPIFQQPAGRRSGVHVQFMMRAADSRARMRTGILCLALGAPVFVTRAGAAELTLDAALARARAANATLVAAAAELDAARGRRVQAGLLPANPVLSGDMARHTDPTTSQIDRGVALAQEIEVGGQRGLRVAGADHDVARADFLLADRRRLVDADVRRAFSDVVASMRRRRLAEASVAIAARIVEATGRRARAGDVAALDVRLAAIERARADQALDVATAEQAAATARLAAVLNLPPDEDVGVVDDPYEPAALAPEVELVARALAA